LTQYPNLPMDRYRAQPFYHQVSSWPGMQLAHQEPYIIVVPNFLSDSECKDLISHVSVSAEQASSSTGPAQDGLRTSTTLVAQNSEVAWLRERVAKLVNVDESQLHATKLTRYNKGEFFKPHSDAFGVLPEKGRWVERMQSGEENKEQLTGTSEPCFWPDRFCTVFIYLNTVSEEGGGRTIWKGLTARNELHQFMLPDLAERELVPPLPEEPELEEPEERLAVLPRAGLACIHFPCTTAKYMTLPDMLAVHESETSIAPKFICQQFIWSAPLNEAAESWQQREDTSGWFSG